MIVWTINRLGDGPMNAYKNLGDDLTGDTPHTANALIISMASAIIRNCIANSTIEQIIKERKELKDKIITQLNKVVAGWGVWLETVEITDVKICSGKLFKDLQCRFRKDEEKKALITQREADQEITIERAKNKLMTDQRAMETKKTKDLEASKQQIIDRRSKHDATKVSNILVLEKTKRDNQTMAKKYRKEKENEIRQAELNQDKRKNEMANEIELIKKEAEILEQQLSNELEEHKTRLAIEYGVKSQELEIKKKQFDMIREKMSDENFLRQRRAEVITEVYSRASYDSSYKFDNMEGEDPIVMAVDNLINAQLGKHLN